MDIHLSMIYIVRYGKQKTWMLISLILSSISIFVMSFYTAMNYCNFFAIICIITQIIFSALDISQQASMIKQFKQSTKPTVIINYSVAIGYLVGGFCFLQLSSSQFAVSIGLQNPIAHPQTIIFVFFLVSLIPIPLVHFQFQQTILSSQIGGENLKICQIISYYSIFFNKSSRYFRICIYCLIQIQGFSFFDGLYGYNLTESGFSKSTYNYFINLVIIPKIIIAFYVIPWAKAVGGFPNALVIVNLILITLKIYILIIFPLNEWIVGLYMAINQIGNLFLWMALGFLINSFPINAINGILITFASSVANFSRIKSIHVWITRIIGWRLASYIGLGIQIIINLCIYRFYSWIQEGDVSIPKQIQEQFQPLNNQLFDKKEEQLQNQ